MDSTWEKEAICMQNPKPRPNRAQFHGSAYDPCALQGSVSAEFCGKQNHEIGPRLELLFITLLTGKHIFVLTIAEKFA